MNRKLLLAILTLIALTAADALTTVASLRLGAAEVNPLYQVLGFNIFFTTKILFTAVLVASIVCVYNFLAKQKSKLIITVWVLVAVLNTMFLTMLVNNVVVLATLLST